MRRPDAVVAVVAAGWGTIGLVVREVDLSATAIVFARVGIGATALGLGLAVAGRRPGRPRSGPLLTYAPARTLAQGALLAGHWVAMFAALQRAPIGTVLLTIYLAPVLVALVAPRLLGEPITSEIVIALVLAVGGSALVLGPEADGVSTPGLVLALVAAVTYAGLILNARALAPHYGGQRLAFIQLGVATAILAPVAWAQGGGWPSGREWAWLAVLGVLHTAIGVALYLSALAHLPATHAGVLAYLEPVSAVLFGWWLLDETPGAVGVAGGALIIAAGVLIVRGPHRAGVTSVEVAGVSG